MTDCLNTEFSKTIKRPGCTNLVVRHFRKKDVTELLRLMRELAEFENYIEEFKVTGQSLIERGLCERPEFYALVCHEENSRRLSGMAVFYLVTFTFTLQTDLVLKEFYVDPAARRAGVGKSLFKALRSIVAELNCSQMHWLVMNGNSRAEEFYSAMGGKHDSKWQRWFWANSDAGR